MVSEARNRQAQVGRLAGEPLGMGEREGTLKGSDDPGGKGSALPGNGQELITSL